MKQEEYPEKIYARMNICKNFGTWTTGEYNELLNDKEAAKHITKDMIVNINDVKYTRSDLVPKWHKFPEEKPKKYWQICNVTLKLTKPENAPEGFKELMTVPAFWDGFEEKWFSVGGKNKIDHTDNVIAYQELPQPFKEG